LRQTLCLLAGTLTLTSFSFTLMMNNRNGWMKLMKVRGLTIERIFEILIIVFATWFIIAGCQSGFFTDLV